jgi:hypothetical protein
MTFYKIKRIDITRDSLSIVLCNDVVLIKTGEYYMDCETGELFIPMYAEYDGTLIGFATGYPF